MATRINKDLFIINAPVRDKKMPLSYPELAHLLIMLMIAKD